MDDTSNCYIGVVKSYNQTKGYGFIWQVQGINEDV
jgi:cold shock CspA family protein